MTPLPTRDAVICVSALVRVSKTDLFRGARGTLYAQKVWRLEIAIIYFIQVSAYDGTEAALYLTPGT